MLSFTRNGDMLLTFPARPSMTRPGARHRGPADSDTFRASETRNNLKPWFRFFVQRRRKLVRRNNAERTPAARESKMSDATNYQFRNAVTELRDCEDILDHLLSGVTDDGQPMPADELRATARLVECCIDIVALVADEAQLSVNLDLVRDSIETVLRTANGAPLTARHDDLAQRLLVNR
jgi:hypothetical protein